jgi:two-component system LytT family response regulator
MITAIIIDDEKSGRETLAFLLEKHFAGRLKLLGTGNSVKEAVELIAKYDPQLVFLDMEMPHEHGLTLVSKLARVNFEIIVTTAHREYGIDALKAGVLDYLLKPVDLGELDRSLKMITEKISEKEEIFRLKQRTGVTAAAKIPLVVGNNKTVFVEVGSIIRCEADGNYTKIWLSDGKPELITRLIKDVEASLSGFNFFRVHKSHLVNISHIKAYLRSDDNIAMSDGSLVPLSRNIKAEFLKKMDL